MTAIEWTHRPGTVGRTWNPVTGCRKVSEGCRHCYAETVAARFWGNQYAHTVERGFITTRDYEAEHLTGRLRKFTDVLCHEDRLAAPLAWRKPSTVFVNSMSDLFHEDVPDAFIDQVFAVMALCPQHTFICLTKRPERMLDYRTSSYLIQHDDGRVNIGPRNSVLLWPNVWLGVSVEDQATADERIPLLVKTPTALRFVSAEPLLGPVDLTKYLRSAKNFHLSASVSGMLSNQSFFGLQDDAGRALSRSEAEAELRALLAKGVERIPCADACVGFDERTGCPGHSRPRLDWLIVGGESGPSARPCNVAWIRSLKDQAAAAHVPIFVKQLGALPTERGRPALIRHTAGFRNSRVGNRKGSDPSEWPADLRVREWPEVTR